jgi:hypothetical protein
MLVWNASTDRRYKDHPQSKNAISKIEYSQSGANADANADTKYNLQQFIAATCSIASHRLPEIQITREIAHGTDLVMVYDKS